MGVSEGIDRATRGRGSWPRSAQMGIDQIGERWSMDSMRWVADLVHRRFGDSANADVCVGSQSRPQRLRLVVSDSRRSELWVPVPGIRPVGTRKKGVASLADPWKDAAPRQAMLAPRKAHVPDCAAQLRRLRRKSVGRPPLPLFAMLGRLRAGARIGRATADTRGVTANETG